MGNEFPTVVDEPSLGMIGCPEKGTTVAPEWDAIFPTSIYCYSPTVDMRRARASALGFEMGPDRVG